MRFALSMRNPLPTEKGCIQKCLNKKSPIVTERTNAEWARGPIQEVVDSESDSEGLAGLLQKALVQKSVIQKSLIRQFLSS